MSTRLRILNPTSFFCHDPWDYLSWGGVCVVVWTGEAIPPRRGLRYQRKKVVGRMERVVAAGGFWDGGGWLLFQPLHQDPLKRSPSRLICHGSEVFPLIGYNGQADVGAAAGGSDDSSTSLSHRGMVSQQLSLSISHTKHTPLAWVTLKDRDTLRNASFIKYEHKCFPLNYVCFWNVFFTLTEGIWIHVYRSCSTHGAADLDIIWVHLSPFKLIEVLVSIFSLVIHLALSNSKLSD